MSPASHHGPCFLEHPALSYGSAVHKAPETYVTDYVRGGHCAGRELILRLKYTVMCPSCLPVWANKIFLLRE